MERRLCSVGTTSGKFSIWVNHGKIRYFACRLPSRASTLNLFNRVVYFDESSGFNGYIESVEMYTYFKSIPTGLISARMTYLCEKFKIQREPLVPFRSRWHRDRSQLWTN